MIVYREFSSLEADLGCSAKKMYSLSNDIRAHYRETHIPKGNGELRKLLVPDDELKALQRKIADVLLAGVEISPYALAYRPGGGTLRNALPHIGRERLLKLDIRHFFDRITYALVRTVAFPPEVYSESNGTLLANLCCFNECLPQGAPTSPAISNIILRPFDDTVGEWCRERGIRYTRYCDDLTFSGNFAPEEVKAFAAEELKKLGFFLNEKKTVSVKQGQKMTVTGITVNSKPAVSAAYKRKLRQEMYYCEKYTIAGHLREKGIDETESAYARKLLGRVNYVLSVERENAEYIHYKEWLVQAVKKEYTQEGSEINT